MPDWGLCQKSQSHKDMEVMRDGHCCDPHQDEGAMLLRTPRAIMPGEGVIYWNLDWHILVKWVRYFAPLSEEELLLSLHWILLPAGWAR